MLRCLICSKEAESKDYCHLHEKACDNLMEKYSFWKEALDLSWKDYLIEVAKNPLSGLKAREVAENMLKRDKSVLAI